MSSAISPLQPLTSWTPSVWRVEMDRSKFPTIHVCRFNSGHKYYIPQYKGVDIVNKLKYTGGEFEVRKKRSFNAASQIRVFYEERCEACSCCGRDPRGAILTAAKSGSYTRAHSRIEARRDGNVHRSSHSLQYSNTEGCSKGFVRRPRTYELDLWKFTRDCDKYCVYEEGHDPA